MAAVKIPVTIVTDTLCPWCYIGKKRFEAAIAQYKQVKGNQVDFQISYEPFQLDSTLPKSGIPRLEHYYNKFGKSRFDQMNVHVRSVGASVGINFAFSDGQLIGNSLDSHRLIKYAGTVSRESQDQAINALYRAYFEEGNEHC
ncbi:thioredoxin-like protein [Obelidium mucronatum]|nr:thioredoxin-like protein [Obelidium mucronatum]